MTHAKQHVSLLIVAVMLAASLAGCETVSRALTPDKVEVKVLPKNSYVVAQRTVYGANAAYEAALTLAVAYAELPRCQPGATPLTCSNQKVVDQTVLSRNVARDALKAADVVFAPGFDKSVLDSSVLAADAALKAFITIANSLGGKK